MKMTLSKLERWMRDKERKTEIERESAGQQNERDKGYQKYSAHSNIKYTIHTTRGIECYEAFKWQIIHT